MAEMNITTRERGRGNRPRAKKLQTRVDMTPMVDLGFLLITFFILTTSLIKMNTMQITVPNKDGKGVVGDKLAVTILMDKDNNLYYYFGGKKNGIDPQLIKTDYTRNGIRQMLLARNLEVNKQIRSFKYQYETGKISEKEFHDQVAESKKLKTAPVVIIKATDEATYNNIVNILDEVNICNIGKYALVDITDYDKDLIKKYKVM